MSLLENPLVHLTLGYFQARISIILSHGLGSYPSIHIHVTVAANHWIRAKRSAFKYLPNTTTVPPLHDSGGEEKFKITKLFTFRAIK